MGGLFERVLFGATLKKVLSLVLTIFIIVSIFVVIKNRLDLTEKYDRELFVKGLGKLAVNSANNFVSITTYILKLNWVPELTKEKNITNKTNNNNTKIAETQ